VYLRTASQSLDLPDQLRPAEATKADRLEVALAVAVAAMAVVVSEDLLLPVVDVRSS
jgi:hypothetical protein